MLRSWTLIALISVALWSPNSWGACAGPEVQVSPQSGQAIGAGCTVSVALPVVLWSEVPRLGLEWAGGPIPVDVSPPREVNVSQREPVIDVETCEEHLAEWDVPFLLFTLTPQQPLPLQTEIRLLLQDEVLADLRAEATASCAGPVTPTVGMCGDGMAPPVPGCDLLPPMGGEGAEAPGEEPTPARSGGCSMGGSHRSTELAPPLALLLMVLIGQRRRSQQREARTI